MSTLYNNLIRLIKFSILLFCFDTNPNIKIYYSLKSKKAVSNDIHYIICVLANLKEKYT